MQSTLIKLAKIGLIIAVLACAAVFWLVQQAQTQLTDCTDDQDILANPAATLWYNRPSTAIFGNTLYLGYVAGRLPLGDTQPLRHVPVVEGRIDDLLMRLGSYSAEVAGWNADGQVVGRVPLKSWHSPDDHSAPAILATPKGLIAAYAHHSSQLFVRTGGPKWTTEKLIEPGSATYPRLLSFGSKVALIYARGKPGPAGGRDLVYRISNDDGEHWGPTRVFVKATPGSYVYASRAVARGDNGFCVAYSMFGPLLNGGESRSGLNLVCQETNGLTDSVTVPVEKLGQDILVFDVAIKNGTPRIAFTACAEPYNEHKLWSDCPALIAEFNGERWTFRQLGIMASSTMPGGMSFDPIDPDRIVIVQRIRAKVNIVVRRLDGNKAIEKMITTEHFPTMPIFTGYTRPSLIWNEMRWFSSGRHHHMQLVGQCGVV